MDYIFWTTLLIAGSVGWLVVSYDIACQWSRNLHKRVSEYPSDMQTSFLNALVWFFVPKFHLAAHGEKCQGPYSLNWRKWVGRTDGEGIERGWSLVNQLATMLREMGPGFRHDTFDNHWSALNWKKLTGLGKYYHISRKPLLIIHRKITKNEASARYKKHFETLTQALEEDSGSQWHHDCKMDKAN